MKELTKAEEQIMQILWDLEKGFVNDIIEKMDEPKPAYNTVSTIVRILVKKQFVGFTAFGKSHQYHPLIDKDTYRSYYMKNFMGSYFNGSLKKMVSFFAKENNINVRELDELMREVKNDIDNNQKEG
ncbi:MAG: BlaI/MecI/CopY family transcriptional regulator [Cyclobacteriaceae bacterium]